MIHYHLMIWKEKNNNSYHFFGHSHGKLTSFNRKLALDVDCHNFYPISYK